VNHKVPLVLLPPSESKYEPSRGSPIDLGTLSFPSLGPLRAALLDDRLRAAPTVAAGRLYTGVLYNALEIWTLPAHAARNIVIVSAQFGVLRTVDRVPAYKRELEAAYWRDALRAPLEGSAEGRVVLDCRSATYTAAWRPARGSTITRVHVSVVEERDGVRRVVSHFAKKTRGEVARHVLCCGIRPRNATDLFHAVSEQFRCELISPARPGDPYELTVVQPAP
jgi:uncharacterized protein